MILLFELIILTSIWCLGIKIITASGMVMERLGIYAAMKVDDGKKIWDPLVACEWCLPSFHSLFGYAFAIGIGVINVFQWKLVFMWPLVVMGASITTGLTWTVYRTVYAIKEYYSSSYEEDFDLTNN